MSVIDKTFSPEEFRAIYFVEPSCDGMRLDQFVAQYLPSWSRQMIKKKIKEGEITILDRPGIPRPSTTVHWKNKIKASFPRAHQEEEYWNGQKIAVDHTPEIITEDKDMIIIGKPPYMAAHPTGKHLYNCATVYFEQRDGHLIHSVHRLDRETSGILVLAKNPNAANTLSKLFENDLVRKCYFFIAVKSDLYRGEKEFVVNQRLGTTDTGIRRVYIHHYDENSSEGRPAQTFFKVLYDNGKTLLGLAFPVTGRQHQIRVHALFKGIPLLGDKLYLGSFEMFQRFKDQLAGPEDHQLMQIPRHALHAIGLSFFYNGELRIFHSHIPQDLKEWMSKNVDINISEFEKNIFNEIDLYFKRSKR